MTEDLTFQNAKPLSDLCTLGIGGPAAYYVIVSTAKQLQRAIQHCREKGLCYFILGKGSNILFDDRGFSGVVIHNKIDFLEERLPGVFRVGSGHSFSALGTLTARKGWSGLEFAAGIPGTVGGAVFMNAGANGSETCHHLTSVECVSDEGNLRNYQRKDLHFSYRYSSFHDMMGAIVSATFSLTLSDSARTDQMEIIQYRTKTQPYGEKSAGCMFRNPKGHHAGALIEQCGLKGYNIGGMQVSAKHANFLINTGKGTSSDAIAIVRHIGDVVREKTGIELENEVRYIAYDDNIPC